MSNMFKFSSSQPQKFSGGDLYRASLSNFSALKGLAIQSLRLDSGAVREPHVHPNANQLDYCVAGTAKVGIVGPDGQRQQLDLGVGDISFVPQGYLHWIENTASKDLEFLVVLSHEEPETIELSEMLAGVSNDTLGKLYGLRADMFKHVPKSGIRIGKGP